METAQAEVKESVAVIPVVVNTADDPRNLSVTSVGALPESVDRAAKEETQEEKAAPEEKKEEAPAPEKKEEPAKEEKDEKQPKTPEQVRVEQLEKELEGERKRIPVLTKARREAERLAESRDQKIKELEEELKKAKAAVPPKDKPKLTDFDSEEEFMEALADWKVEQKLREKEEKTEKETREVTEKQAVDEEYDALDARMEKGRGKYEDFNKVVLDENLRLSESMVEAILFSDNAEDILYYLGKHPEESAKIADLPPMKAASELGKIEAKLTEKSAEPSPPEPPKKKVTQAPEPITPVKTTGAIEKDPARMTQREYRAWRESKKT